ncbi:MULTISPECIES: RIP metalloprotease [Anaerolinea]|uniref:M50 family metallopeptidase n=1 Tax=Anaerolinea TaxID=233189 RepID=UPI00262339B0|nr:M50 family metallopeptidase [Anaerolinea thermophila]
MDVTGLLKNIGQILEFVLALGILIFLHELGHFIFARLFKIEVLEFGFGLPPRMVKLFTWKGTEVTLNWIPFGAFVRPKGENDPSIPDGMAAANPWKRFFILLGGPLMNFVTAIAIFSLMYILTGAPETQKVQIIEVNSGSPAEMAGMMPGDLVLSVEGRSIDSMQALSEAIRAHLGEEVSIVVSREGQILTLKATPRQNPPEGQGPLGIVMGNPIRTISVPEALPYALRDTASQARTLISLPVLILRGEVSGEQTRLIGPVGMERVYREVRQMDVQSQQENPNNVPIRTLILLASISIGLGVANLFPIPALDGGRILFLLPEIFFKKRIPPEQENLVNLIGFTALILLMIFITTQDIVNPIQLP